MVGFLGNQYLLSSTGLGANAEEHSTITLKNGTVITAYFTSNGGPVKIYSFNPKTKATTELGGFGSITTNFSDPQLVPTDDGGFRIVYSTETQNGGMYYRKYDADANLVDQLTLATGWIENARAYDTGTGFFVFYRDRSPDPGEPEAVGAFYDESGTLLNSFDFAANATSPFYGYPDPQATVLSNGNLAVVWQKNSRDGSFLQIFGPDGTAIGAEKPLTDIPINARPGVIEPIPGGGFYVAHAPYITPPGATVGSYGQIVIQKYTNAGNKSGPEIVFDTAGESGGKLMSYLSYDLAITKDGLIALSWAGQAMSGGTQSDVYLAVLTAGGKEIIGPTAADVTLNDNQLDVQFNYLKNGQVFLTFKDDATLQFNYVASIQGRFIVDPDYVWEGNAQNNTKAGTAGNDVLLGLAGDDTLSGGKGEDLIRGGNGNDLLSGGNRLDILYGEAGNDELRGDRGDDTLFGGNGKDVLKGGEGNDALYGGDKGDTLRGGTGDDQAFGGNGNDRLFGDAGDDELRGDAGDDTLAGGAGDDRQYGGTGKDVLRGNAGNDLLVGDAGRDRLFGGDGLDILRGEDGNDVLRAGAGDDALYGGKGRDKMFGEGGDDTFYDSAGVDIMTGGTGADTFLFNSTAFGKDRITDFEVGVDTLDMGWAAYGLQATGGSITVSDVAEGVKFEVDADNWVIIENLTMSQLTAGTDYLIESPI